MKVVVDLDKIRGEKGIDGKTPEKGVDYFTQKELEDFSFRVFNMVPKISETRLTSNIQARFSTKFENFTISSTKKFDTFKKEVNKKIEDFTASNKAEIVELKGLYKQIYKEQKKVKSLTITQKAFSIDTALRDLDNIKLIARGLEKLKGQDKLSAAAIRGLPSWAGGGGSSGGGATINGLTGAVTLSAGTNIALNQVAQNIEIALTGTIDISSQTNLAVTSPIVLTGDTISIQDAAADGATKGAAAFNSTNFSAASGVVNTIQNIHTSATPTFSSLNLSATSNQIVLQSAGIKTILTESGATSDKTITFPNFTGTLATIGALTQTFSGQTTFSHVNGIAVSGGIINLGTYQSPYGIIIGDVNGIAFLDPNSIALLQFDSGTSQIYIGESTLVGVVQFISSGSIEMKIGSTVEATFGADTLTFNNGTTDTFIDWGTDATLKLGVGSTTELTITATQIDLGSATTDVINFIAGAGATAPSTTATPTFTAYYGGNTNALGDPVAWLNIKANGTNRKVPLY